MARRQKHEEHENLERWLVSYADFITLLFAFFVMLYAISAVNTGKFRVMSHAIVAEFEHKTNQKVIETVIPKDTNSSASGRGPQVSTTNSVMYQALERATNKNIKTAKGIHIVRTPEGIVIRIQSSLLFKAGHARIEVSAVPALRSIVEVLAKSDREIRVRGYTDNNPIHTAKYPDNWALSAARALSVTRFFVGPGKLDPERVGATGFGEHRPLSPNMTEEGRRANRRVEIVILNKSVPSKTGSVGKAGNTGRFANPGYKKPTSSGKPAHGVPLAVPQI